MKDEQLAKRYAKAMFLGASSISEAEAIADKMELFGDLFSKEDVVELLTSPIIPKQVKNQVINFACDKIESDQKIRSFVFVVLEGNRIGLMPQIIGQFKKILLEKKSETIAQVYSTDFLNDDQKREIEQAVQNRFGVSSCRIENHIDRSLIGGLKICVGRRVLDLSVSSRLKNIAEVIGLSN